MCNQYICNFKETLTLYTYNMKDKRNSFPGFYMFGRLMLLVS
jgi:hypothetical protein